MATPESVTRYQIDSQKSRFTVKAVAAGLLSTLGHNPTIAVRDFSGEAGFVPGSLEQAYIRVTARPDSFEVTDDISAKDKSEIESRMKQEVLETGRFPEIKFESTSISPLPMGGNSFIVKVTGDLSLHGAMRSQTITARVSTAGDVVRGFGEFTLKQTDFGITLVSVAGGTLKIKDELRITFDFTARKLA
jgi:polyisoprenoid-binding protein YceI